MVIGYIDKATADDFLSKVRQQAPGDRSDPSANKGASTSRNTPATKVELSPEAKKHLAEDDELSTEEKEQVRKLEVRDRQVRTHEQAHVAAGGQYIKGGIHYEYQKGPDNKDYAIGGHVQIDTTPIKGDPQRTIEKARVVQRAALAPADPSGADRRVASKARAMEANARREVAEEARAEAAEAREATTESSGLNPFGESEETAIAQSIQADAPELRPARPTASASVGPSTLESEGKKQEATHVLGAQGRGVAESAPRASYALAAYQLAA